MFRAKGGLSLLLVLAAGLVLAPSARADSQVRIVRLSLVSGPAQIDRGDGYEKAITNMPITQGMKLWTQGDSRAEVEFENGATMRLAPGAKVEFEQLALLTSGAKASLVKVDSGCVYFNVPHKGENEFRVAFDNQQLNLTRAVHFRLGLTLDQVEIAVFKGELTLPGEKEIKLKKNETAMQERSVREFMGDASEQGAFEVAKGITAGAYDEWDAYRLEFDNQYASANSKYVPYSYGRSDLNYYGSWGYVSGYGDLWRPYGFGYGWDPFGAGYWAWYPTWGYTWVSAYPWGWIPYRYGNWIWINNYGWCWRPGGLIATGFVPPVSPPTGYVGPQPPPVTPVAGTGGTGASGGAPRRPPTVFVGGGPGSRLPRPVLDNDGNVDPTRAPAGATRIPTPGTATAGTSTGPGTAAPASATSTPPRPARTSVPSSGPGIGRRPVALDEAGVIRGGAREGGRSVTGLGAPASPRTSGSQPSTPRGSAPPAASSRPSAPSAHPRSTAAPASRPSPPAAHSHSSAPSEMRSTPRSSSSPSSGGKQSPH